MDFPAFSILSPPGFGYRTMEISRMLRFGRDLRERLLWDYPIMPGAVMTYVQMASSREIKVSATTARAAARAVDWLNDAVCYNLDGSIDYGYPNILKRRCLDYITIGRTIYDISDELRYLDPTQLDYIFNYGREPYYRHKYTNEIFHVSSTIVNHPYPIGDSGYFMCPLAPVLQTAMLAWLIREHDQSSADGRKIRDIYIAGSEKLAETFGEVIKHSAELWAGADPKTHGIAIAYVDSIPAGVNSVQDMIGKLGLANIPDNFDRDQFEFKYVNEIAAALGISLRHFWNSERATNRALEEVQDARQLQKGPSEFIRTEQRLLNGRGAMKRFGDKTRMGFIEETDSATKLTNAQVLKSTSDALMIFATVFNGQVNGEAFLSWLQSEDILPADLELVTNMGTMINPDQLPVSGDPDNPQQAANPNPSPLSSGKASVEKSVPLDYGEIAMDLDYKIIDKRYPIYTVEKLISEELEKDVELKPIDVTNEFDFYHLLGKAQQDNYAKLVATPVTQVKAELHEVREKSLDTLTDEEHRKIAEWINEKENPLSS